MAVVMLVCVGFIVSLIILGVMRVRNAKRCGGGEVLEEKQELDWDNSALTVTVNPMHPDVSHCTRRGVASCVKKSWRAKSCNFTTDGCKFPTAKLLLRSIEQVSQTFTLNSYIACIELDLRCGLLTFHRPNQPQ